jgi:glycosyltransferase involved in cell wall biosynthesis
VRRVLFYRDYDRFTGGHLKVWHYFNHVLEVPGFEPFVRFTRTSRWDHDNPWFAVPDRRVGRGFRPDVRFLGGLDWRAVPARRRLDVPVLNLIQHVRHADPSDPRFAYLRHRAVRICVSQEVADAVISTGMANGPVLTIPNGIDRSELPRAVRPGDRSLDLLVVAHKQPDLGARLHDRLKQAGRRARLLAEPIPRPDFLAALASSRVALLLPRPTEGFYLPALEAMALDNIVVCPDCVGNRSFCQDGVTGFHPPHNEDAILAATRAALAASEIGAESLRLGARVAVADHDLSEERRRFVQVLTDLDVLWAG